MHEYKCRKCGCTFKKIDPLIILPVCDRCKREKEQLKVLKNGSSSNKKTTKEGDSNTFLGFIVLVAIIFVIWAILKGWGMLTYWDKIYVKNNLLTYDTIEFSNKPPVKVKFDDTDRVECSVKVYNTQTGDNKNVILRLPLYKIWTREQSRKNLDGEKNIIGYRQPMVEEGKDFIKPSDAILEGSPVYNNIVENAKLLYRKENYKDFINWTFEKPAKK